MLSMNPLGKYHLIIKNVALVARVLGKNLTILFNNDKNSNCLG